MTAPVVAASPLGPYKGPDSYEVRDAYLFQGREREANEIIALVLSCRLAVLHAPSGAGKTSLLNARVLPGLQELGWLPIRIRPGFNPIGAIKVETLKRALVCPAVEVAAIERAARELAVDDGAPLGDLLEAYRKVPRADDRKRTLLEPLDSPVRGFGETSPMFHGWLQEYVDDATFDRHLEVVIDEEFRSARSACSQATIRELVGALSRPEAERLFQTLLARLNVPAIPLAAFYENLASILGPRHPELALVLILDQFEELFTRFIDPGPPPADAPQEILKKRREQPDWRLRHRFFDELEELYGCADGSPTILPIRYLVSLRDDYYAKLGPLRKIAGDLDRVAYHLELLGREAAAHAIREPAEIYGYGYSEDLFARILQELTREDRYIEPAHLQMVCSKLWRESGMYIARRSGGDTGPKEIEVDELDRLEGTVGIFASVLTDFLDSALLDERERNEAIEMLELLITVSYKRNIVERDTLVQTPFKNSALRERILRELETARIVSIHVRHDGYFVEITHEFLIPAVLERARALGANPQHAQRSLALLSLSRLEDQDLVGRATGLLSEREFQALDRDRDDLEWPEWSVEAMMRSAIGVGASGEAVRRWADRFDTECTVPPLDVLRRRLRHLSERGSRLNLDELTVLTRADRASAEGAEGEEGSWDDRQLDVILRSVLAWAPEERSADVVHWAVRHGETDA